MYTWYRFTYSVFVFSYIIIIQRHCQYSLQLCSDTFTVFAFSYIIIIQRHCQYSLQLCSDIFTVFAKHSSSLWVLLFLMAASVTTGRVALQLLESLFPPELQREKCLEFYISHNIPVKYAPYPMTSVGVLKLSSLSSSSDNPEAIYPFELPRRIRLSLGLCLNYIPS